MTYAHDTSEPEDFTLVSEEYFAETILSEAEWAQFLDLLTATPSELRSALKQEEEQYGPTAYRSHTFDRMPLVRFSDGRIVPTSFASLERAVTEGTFWRLANGIESEGLPREAFTSPFGEVFERATQEAFERISQLEADPSKALP